mmetsp:Transcript_47878/g.117425  ORF Transcript_47878/g.117425 Transcript_47878/m.117425 type:complete len:238 (-) Transcript_47878:391-1104(-)
MCATLGVHKSCLRVGHQVLHDRLLLTERRPPMFLRVGLEVLQAAVHRRTKQRKPTHRIIEGRHLINLGEQLNVRSLVQKLRLRICTRPSVAAHSLSQSFIRVHSHRHCRGCTTRNPIPQVLLDWPTALVERCGWAGTHSLLLGYFDRLNLQVHLAVGTLSPHFHTFDSLQCGCSRTHILVISACTGLFSTGRAPLVTELGQWYTNVRELTASWNRELRLEATSTEGNRTSSCTSVGR